MSNYRGRLHVYSQYTPHDDAVIVGDKDALTALRDAITQALESRDASFNSFTADGEGYSILVKTRESDNFYAKVGLPYTADYHGNSDGALDPRDPEADADDVQD